MYDEYHNIRLVVGRPQNEGALIIRRPAGTEPRGVELRTSQMRQYARCSNLIAALAAMSCLLWSIAIPAQPATATLEGRVVDPTGTALTAATCSGARAFGG